MSGIGRQGRSTSASGRGTLSRREALACLLGAAGTTTMAGPTLSRAPHSPQPVVVGAEALAASGFAALAGKRVGLVTNQTGRAGGEHLVDLLVKARNVRLTAIYAPEHGFRGAAEAGASVKGGVDAATGIPIHSLYGSTRKPTPAMLRDVDVLVFDIQDVGARFYTYISTMGLAMQAAAQRRMPFLVLDRPNPLGGEYVSGFVLEPPLRSFVGQYPIPMVHGLTVGELARMIKGERWLDGLDGLDLDVVQAKGWERPMRWPRSGRAWVATSPNIPTFEAALVYPGIGIVGEAEVSEGRGTPTPFTLFGAPWLDGAAIVARLNQLNLAGVRFEIASFRPRSMPGIATRPRFEGVRLKGVRLVVTDADRIEPLEIGMHALAMIAAEARARGIAPLFANVKMFHAIAGTRRLLAMLGAGADGAAIIAAWQPDVASFKARRAPYLIY